ncbi:MAG TPA: sigma-70 family RNA polymerase sigma factor [bacterium]|nr:sigma-70 family RNA polymerase sigma factor [bacterium]
MPATAEQLARCSRGEVAAFSDLYQASAPHLFALALRILSKKEWAEEVLQEAFTKIWTRSSDYDIAKGSPLTWMGTIVRNTAIDRLRRNRREMPLDLEPLLGVLKDEGPGPQERAAQSLESEALGRCLEELSEEQRRSLGLAYWKGLSHGEISKALARPLGTVKAWVRRGLDQLRRCLER